MCLVALIVWASHTQAAVTPAVISAEVISRGPHHRTWRQILQTTGPSGQIINNSSTYEEWATGMHYWNQDQWMESREEIELIDGMAIARQTPHQVSFVANINTVGAIDLVTPDNQRLNSHVIGLAYHDTATGQSVWLGEVRDSMGLLHPPNTIVYESAFSGVAADLRYKVTRSRFEQDVILREAPPSPAAFGFNPATTRLEVITEFIDPPIPQKHVRLARGFEDEILDFGIMQIAYGKAFFVDGAHQEGDPQPVAKGWYVLPEGTFLVESLDYPSIQPDLDRLPPANQEARLHTPKAGRMAWVRERQRLRAAVEPNAQERIQLAKGPSKNSGFVIDYVTVASGSSLTLGGSNTFYVSGDVIVTNLTIDGGTVVKYTNGASIEVIGTIQCKTAPYRPGIFTSWQDHTVGAQIGAGTLSGYYADTALILHDANHQLKHLRISHAQRAISLDDGDVTLDHCQFTHCQKALALDYCAGYFNNVLAYSVSNVVAGDHLVLKAQHLTAGYCTQFSGDASSNGVVTITNSIFLDVASLGNSSFASNSLLRTSDSSIFKTVGGAKFYLADGSPWRDAGTTNIRASLLSDLKTKTTWAPLLLTNEISLDTVLQPQVPRDTDQPDYGYHFESIDYAINSLSVTNATVLLTNGVALATFGSQGFLLRDYASLISEGSPQRPNIFTRYYAVQEQTTNWGNGIVPSTATINPYNSGISPPTVRLRFTESNVQSHGGYHTLALVGTSPDWRFTQLYIKDSRLYGSTLSLHDTNTATFAFTNNLLENVYFDLWPVYVETEDSYAPISYAQNNLLRSTSGEWFQLTTNMVTWKFFDNLLDSSPFYNISPYMDHQKNRFYNSAAFYEFYPTNNTELILTSLSYQTGALGDYYQPSGSALINAGSLTNAALIGLFHFTTTTNQVKETNSWLDIGMHYVAVDPSTGLPLDADGDTFADYFEDTNGNGQVDSGETDWTTYDSLLGIGGGSGLVVFTPPGE